MKRKTTLKHIVIRRDIEEKNLINFSIEHREIRTIQSETQKKKRIKEKKSQTISE